MLYKLKQYMYNHIPKKLHYYILYTVIFLILSWCIFGMFAANGKSLVYGSLIGSPDQDGLTQHFNALIYYRNYLRDFFTALLTEHVFEFKMWDMNIGLGSDILTTLHYYVIGDPLNLFSVFVPTQYMEQFYEFLIILRVYLAGLSYCYYCRTWKKQTLPTLTGAVVYSFCGYILVGVLKHPFFANPMIYLPLILAGVDKILKGKKPWLYIGMVCLSAVSNFYFFYMICVFTFLYAIFRYLWLYKTLEWKKIINYIIKFIGYALIGIAIAAPILLPNIMAVIESSRSGAEKYIPVLYDSDYYQKTITAFMSGTPGYWLCLGFTAVSVFALILLFIQKGKWELKAAFILLTIFACIPWIGHVLNGFSYVTNRWVWAYTMLVAYIVTSMLEDLEKVTEKKKRLLISITIIYGMIVILNQQARTEKGVSALVLLCIMVMLFTNTNIIEKNKRNIQVMFLTVTIIGACINGMYSFSVKEENKTRAFIDRGKALESLQGIPTNRIAAIEDGNLWRYDQYGMTPYYNSTMASGKNGTSYFFSLGNPYVGSFFDEMGLNAYLDYAYNDLDARTVLEGLFSVEYFMTQSGKGQYVPYGYRENMVYGDGVCEIYKADTSIPFGYVYKNWIARETYEEMSIPDKQQAILQGAVLEEGKESNSFSKLQKEDLLLNAETMEYVIEPSPEIILEENGFRVNTSGAMATLSFQGLIECETYVVWDKLKYTSADPLEIAEEGIQELSAYEKKVLKENNKYKKPEEDISINIINGNVRKRLYALTEYSSFYLGKEDFLINIGYLDKGRSKIKLKFSKPGFYSYDKLSIICQPMNYIEQNLKMLKNNALQEIQIETNAVTAKSGLNQSGIASISVPYSKGWKVYIDGKQKETICVNTMFLGVELPEGEHTVQFQYETPYLRIGAVLAIIGMFMLIIVFIWQKWKRGNRSETVVDRTLL